MLDGRLVRVEGDASAIVLDAKVSEGRNGFRPWLVLTTSGGSALLMGEPEIDGTQRLVMISDEASYVRCPASDGKD